MKSNLLVNYDQNQYMNSQIKYFLATQKQLMLLNDESKLLSFLNLAIKIPIPYASLQKTLDYPAIFFHSSMTGNMLPPLKLLLARDIMSILDSQQVAKFLVFFEKLELNGLPWNDALFQRLLMKVIEKGHPELQVQVTTLIQRHLPVEFCIYSLGFIQLREMILLTDCKLLRIYANVVKRASLYREQRHLMKLSDEQPFKILLELGHIEEDEISYFMSSLNTISEEIGDFSLAKQLMTVNITSIILKKHLANMTQAEANQLFNINQTCEVQISLRLSELSTSQFVEFLWIVANMNQKLQAYIWEAILNELAIRDVKEINIQQALCMMFCLKQTGYGQEQHFQRLTRVIQQNWAYVDAQYMGMVLKVSERSEHFQELLVHFKNQVLAHSDLYKPDELVVLVSYYNDEQIIKSLEKKVDQCSSTDLLRLFKNKSTKIKNLSIPLICKLLENDIVDKHLMIELIQENFESEILFEKAKAQLSVKFDRKLFTALRQSELFKQKFA